MELSEEQFQRYARHLILDEVGEEGQEKLLPSRVLVIGAGGLGSPLLLYLAAAGVGTLGIIDNDRVDLYQPAAPDRPCDRADRRAQGRERAAPRWRASIREVRIETHPCGSTPTTPPRSIAGYDLVADGSDNFATRYLLTDRLLPAEEAAGRRGAVAVRRPALDLQGPISAPAHPCYRCLFREAPPPDLVPRCEEAGILGAVAGVMGTLQATEVLKELLGLGESLDGTLLIYDALGARFHRSNAARIRTARPAAARTVAPRQPSVSARGLTGPAGGPIDFPG